MARPKNYPLYVKHTFLKTSGNIDLESLAQNGWDLLQETYSDVKADAMKISSNSSAKYILYSDIEGIVNKMKQLKIKPSTLAWRINISQRSANAWFTDPHPGKVKKDVVARLASLGDLVSIVSPEEYHLIRGFYNLLSIDKRTNNDVASEISETYHVSKKRLHAQLKSGISGRTSYYSCIPEFFLTQIMDSYKNVQLKEVFSTFSHLQKFGIQVMPNDFPVEAWFSQLSAITDLESSYLFEHRKWNPRDHHYRGEIFAVPNSKELGVVTNVAHMNNGFELIALVIYPSGESRAALSYPISRTE